MPQTSPISISRFELYPAVEPRGYVVGFTAQVNTTSRYFDAMVDLADAQGKTDEEIAGLAWTSLKDQYDMWYAEVSSKSPLLGSAWLPSATTPEPEPVPQEAAPIPPSSELQ